MPESTQTNVPISLDNLVLKRWLHCVGPVRRCEVLQKLKTDLKNLGLSRRQVHRGLVQLATRPHVVLTPQPTTRKPKRLSLENEAKVCDEIANACRSQITSSEHYSRRGERNAEQPDTTVVCADEEKNNKTERIKACKDALIKNPRESLVSSKHFKLGNNIPTTLHPFDKALEQLDQIVSSKMSIPEKSMNKRDSVIVSTDIIFKSRNRGCINSKDLPSNKKSTCNQDEDRFKHIDDECNYISSVINYAPVQDKKNCTKSNVRSYNFEQTDSAKSNVNRNKGANIEVGSILCKTKYIAQKSNKSEMSLASIPENGTKLLSNTKVAAKQEKIPKRSRELISSDSLQKRTKIDASIDGMKRTFRKKERQVKSKWRSCFGNCTSISEDEQEQDILQKRFKRRRKKDSVDSCDSGLCITEESTNGAAGSVEILKDIQRAVPDSTIQDEYSEDIKEISIKSKMTNEPKVNEDESVEIINQVENNKSQTNTCAADSVQTEKLISISDESDTVETITIMDITETSQQIRKSEMDIFADCDTQDISKTTITTDVTETFQTTERPEEINPVVKTETCTNTIPCINLETCNADCNAQVVISDDTKTSQENDNLHTKVLNALIEMFLNEKCLITSKGNVVSIKEDGIRDENQNTIKEDIDKQSNLKILSEIISNCNKNDEAKEKEPNSSKKSDYINLNSAIASIDKRAEAVLINDNTCNTSHDINETVLQESELNHTTEEANTQSNKFPQPRLRVLSSAELGSRWCPTPIHPVVSTVSNLLDTSTITISDSSLNSTVPVSLAIPQAQTLPATSVPVSTSASVEATSYSSKQKISIETQRFLQGILYNIYTTIQRIRDSNYTSNLECDKLLYSEFEKLKNTLSSNSYVPLIHGVIKRLNKSMFKLPQLTLKELFTYAPSLTSEYVKTLNYETQIARDNFNERQNVTPNQNMYQNPRMFQTSQNSIPVTPVQNQYSSNLNQTNPSNNSLLNLQQLNYRLQTQRPVLKSRILPTYLNRKTQVTNVHTSQSIPFQQVPQSSIGANQPGNHIYAPVSNTSYLNQQYVAQVYVPPMNKFYAGNASRPNHPIQRNTNSTHTIQQQNINSAYAVGNQNVNLAHTIYPQNINPVHISQETNLTYTNQQQNIRPTQAIQQQNIRPTQAIQQQNIRPTQVIQQQNIDLTQATQQQIIHPTPVIQQQNIHPAQTTQQQNICPRQTIQQQNIQTTHEIQQQNSNQMHTIQQQNSNRIHTIQQQSIKSVGQQFPKTVHTQPVFNTIRECIQSQNRQQLTQNTQQNIPVRSDIPLTVPSAPRFELKSKEQSIQKYKKRPAPKISQNVTSKQKMSPQYGQNIHSSKIKRNMIVSKNKKENITQISSHSIATQFDILTYFSDIQKIILLEHINFYFDCIARFDQEYTPQTWQEINLERSLIINFQRALKHHVEKTIKNYEQNEYQANVFENNLLTNISTDVPKEIQITAQKNEEECQVGKSDANQEQPKTMNVDQCNTILQEYLSVIEEQKQSQKEQEVTNNLQNMQLPDQTQQSNVLNTEAIRTNERDEDVVILQENHPLLTSILEIQTTSNCNENHKSAVNKDLGNSIKKQTSKNIPSKAQKEISVASDLEESTKDVSQQLNSHLVTVEISPNNDHVTVVNIDAADNNKDTVIKTENEVPEECTQHPEELELFSSRVLPPLNNTKCEILTELPHKSSDNNIEYPNDTDTNNFSLEESITSCIADIRSITLEAFENMEEGSNIPISITEGNIEEEEIKICLRCSKPSTVVCSICLEAKYCCKECAELHWQEHYKNCKPVEKSIYF
ncbi:uncharacterized protein LOC143345009 isoform X2 [Colletes latitarsis]|uniref:uncharacterized protein LOC143345009 isoform X2 n=1 Tax=Colletes latitarsis TaxID=2605962 RepID=UPI0040370654